MEEFSWEEIDGSFLRRTKAHIELDKDDSFSDSRGLLNYRGITSGLSWTVTNTANREDTTFQFIKSKMMMKLRYFIR